MKSVTADINKSPTEQVPPSSMPLTSVLELWHLYCILYASATKIALVYIITYLSNLKYVKYVVSWACPWDSSHFVQNSLTLLDLNMPPKAREGWLLPSMRATMRATMIVALIERDHISGLSNEIVKDLHALDFNKIARQACQTNIKAIKSWIQGKIRESVMQIFETPRKTTWINSFSPQKCTFSQQSIFYTLFLNEDGRILKNGLSKLHYRFRRYSTLPKTVLLESQYLQSYDSLPDFLKPKFEEDRHNFADIEIQAKLS